MRENKDPKDVAREKLQQIDPNILRNLQNLAGQYSHGPMTPERFMQFAHAIDEQTLRNLAQQLGVNVNAQMLRSLTPDKIQQLMQLFEDNK